MNVFELIPLTAGLVNFALTIIVFIRGPGSALTRVYLVWGLAIAVWNSGVYFIFRSTNAADALFWARLMQVGVIFLPISLSHLCRLMAHVKTGWQTPAFYILGLIFVATDSGAYFVSDVRNVGYAYYSVAGPAFWVFIAVYMINALSTCWMLYQKQKTVSYLQRVRLRWLIVATLALIVFGANDILPIIGVDSYPLIGSRIYPLGSLAAVLYGLIVAYSVLQYQLLDIHLTLSRLAVQFVRVGFMSLTGFLLLLLVARLAPQGQFTSYAFFGALAVIVASALMASFLFPQFFGKGTDALERHILGDRFEYHARMQTFNQAMRSSPEPESLLEELEDLLVNTVKVRSYQVILLNEITRGFVLYRSFPDRAHVQLPDMRIDSPIFLYFRDHHARYLSCNAAYEAVFERPLEKEARALIQPFEAEFCFPFFVGNELVGLMLLGPKVNQDLFTPHDLHLLTELSSTLGLMLNQIRLRHQLQLAHEQDLLGRMSRGLAHDLNNLLTPVQTLLQLFQEARVQRDTIDELLPMALRNLGTIRGYVNEALFFSRTAKLQEQPGPIEQAISDAIAIVEPSAAGKNLSISFSREKDTIIDMDAVLIKRLICNLLSNAVDASAPGTSIEIVLSELPKTELSRDWYRLQIIDHGEGISPENLKRVFTPYFTTKNTGDGNRGFGLGLAIARKIVHLHGGNLSIVSKEKKGTTVQVDLPSKLLPSQVQQKPPGGRTAETIAA